MTRVAAGFSSSGRLRLPPEENPKGSHHLAGSNTKNAQLIIAIDLIKLHNNKRIFKMQLSVETALLIGKIRFIKCIYNNFKIIWYKMYIKLFIWNKNN